MTDAARCVINSSVLPAHPIRRNHYGGIKQRLPGSRRKPGLRRAARGRAFLTLASEKRAARKFVTNCLDETELLADSVSSIFNQVLGSPLTPETCL